LANKNENNIAITIQLLLALLLLNIRGITMKKILIINGSRDKEGNTQYFISRILENKVIK
jgi:hypothetical protein